MGPASSLIVKMVPCTEIVAERAAESARFGSTLKETVPGPVELLPEAMLTQPAPAATAAFHAQAASVCTWKLFFPPALPKLAALGERENPQTGGRTGAAA